MMNVRNKDAPKIKGFLGYKIQESKSYESTNSWIYPLTVSLLIKSLLPSIAVSITANVTFLNSHCLGDVLTQYATQKSKIFLATLSINSNNALLNPTFQLKTQKKIALTCKLFPSNDPFS